MSYSYVTIIRGGTVIDGTGVPAYAADVIIDGDRIAEIIPRDDGHESSSVVGCGSGRSPSDHESYTANHDSLFTNHEPRTTNHVLDATGCLVTPGFVDSHSHSDAYLVLEPDAPSKLSQGVTTEINGQCGGSVAPRYGEARLSSDWATLLGERLTWRSLAEYRAALAAAKPAINTVQFVGHNTLRSSVVGYAGVRATPETLREMERLLARELDDGAWGLTTGLIYQPGKYADDAEVIALARVATAHGGFYATHMRSEGDRLLESIDEVIALVRATGIRAEISHLKTSGPRNWGKIDAALDKIQNSVDAGLLLGSDRYPYCAAGTDLDVVFPDWAGEGGCPAECARLADSATRARIVRELDSSDRDWSSVTIGGTWHAATKPLCGLSVDAILRRSDLLAPLGLGADATPGEFVCAALALDECRTGAFFFGMSEANLQRICERPWIVPGSDASLRAPWGPLGADHPHPRAYGTMPRFFRLLTGRVDGHAKICSREEAVARMTSVPCRRFRIRNRGELRAGAFADVAVWREDEFCETSTYDRPHSFCGGVEAVFVNGALSYRRGEFLHAAAGRFLERTA